MPDALDRLLRIMIRLRDPVNGCDWDRAQTFATIVPHTIEEAYEVADAIARQDMDAIRDELGDLLFQVVFHARMAEEAGSFDFNDVAQSMVDKLVARHPHIFGDTPDSGLPREERWEKIKAEERAANGATSALEGVALALPGLLRAEKLQKRAARVGFDWPDTTGPADKLHEEIAEFDAATGSDKVEEAGDLLFSAVNLLRAHGISAEEAMRAANAKFERRFRAMETAAEISGAGFDTLGLDQQEELWQQVKASEPRKPA